MKKLMMSVALVALALPLTSQAITITVTQDACGIGQSTCDSLDQEIKDLVGEDLPDVTIGKYGTGLANANSFAYKGLGSDYSDKFSYFMVRGAAGVAVDGDIENADKPESLNGFGIGAAATVGLNLDLLPIDKIGPVDLSKLDLFVSFMSYNYEKDDTDSQAEIDLSSFSVMGRYQIIEGKDIVPGYMLEWGGVFLHTGFQRASWEGNLVGVFDDEQVEVSGQTATFKNSSATFNIETATTTIPVEISTYLRASYVFTFFGGAGFDFVQGSTDVSFDAGGTVEAANPSDYKATISADDSDSGDADATNFRAFAGVQFNIPFVRVYAQLNKGLGNDLVGATVGTKILW